MHFASKLFFIHPRYIQLRSCLLDFFNGEVIDSIHLARLEHVISVLISPTPASFYTTGETKDGKEDDMKNLPEG